MCGLAVVCRRWDGERWEVGAESEEGEVLVDVTR